MKHYEEGYKYVVNHLIETNTNNNLENMDIDSSYLNH